MSLLTSFCAMASSLITVFSPQNPCFFFHGLLDNRTAIPPLHGALLKNEQDVMLFERLAFMARRQQGK